MHRKMHKHFFYYDSVRYIRYLVSNIDKTNHAMLRQTFAAIDEIINRQILFDPFGIRNDKLQVDKSN